MPLSYAELEKFYEGLVARARRRGIACAISRGMAYVAFGVARVNSLPLAQRRRYVGEMVDHAVRKGVKFDKPALGVTP
jgi:hypothetical protein